MVLANGCPVVNCVTIEDKYQVCPEPDCPPGYNVVYNREQQKMLEGIEQFQFQQENEDMFSQLQSFMQSQAIEQAPQVRVVVIILE